MAGAAISRPSSLIPFQVFIQFLCGWTMRLYLADTSRMSVVVQLLNESLKVVGPDYIFRDIPADFDGS